VPPADAQTPPPAAKSAPQAQPKSDQMAALPAPSKGGSKGTASAPQSIDVMFAPGDANLSDAAKAQLDKIADNLKGDEKSRLQLLAYANEDSPSKARRMSLSRALAVRSQLIAKGIRSTRIDVRALGDQVPNGDPNRVDLQITDR
jgi:outer membrane protein OmpA-like peptidoglycan-associated protein